MILGHGVAVGIHLWRGGGFSDSSSTVGADFDGDGFFDVYLPLGSYKAGEIFDCDIFDQHRHGAVDANWPEDNRT
jgi:hypothetical protein